MAFLAVAAVAERVRSTVGSRTEEDLGEITRLMIQRYARAVGDDNVQAVPLVPSTDLLRSIVPQENPAPPAGHASGGNPQGGANGQ